MRYRALTATIKLRTALHMGSGLNNDMTDALCSRSADGQWIIPGTSLAGALRASALRLAPRITTSHHSKTACRGLTGAPDDAKAAALPCQCIVCALFGYRYMGCEESKSNQPQRSRIAITNAVAEQSEQHTRIRDGVGIERSNAVAARATAAKFDFEIVPAGTRFTFRIEFPMNEGECPQSEDQERLLAVVLAEWQAGRATLGANCARGLGAMTLENINYIDRNLAAPDDLLAFLSADAPWLEETWPDDAEAANWLDGQLQQARELRCEPAKALQGLSASRFVVFECQLRAAGALLVNDPAVAAASGFDLAPVLEQLRPGAKPLLPGSSIRGVLRSQAEKIARTITTFEVAGSVDAISEFSEQCPACDSLQSNPVSPIASCDSLLKRKLRENDNFDQKQIQEEHLCLACRVFGSVHGASRLRVEDAPFISEQFNPKAQDFLAIDRFTGGGLDGLKFDAINAWEPHFQLRIQMENPEPWELGWLALALRDIRDGLVPVGYGSARGFGQVTLEEFSVQVGTITDEDFPTACAQLRQLPSGDSGLYRVTQLDEAQWLSSAEQCVTAFQEKLRSFKREPALQAKEDSYFAAAGTDSIPLTELYPMAYPS